MVIERTFKFVDRDSGEEFFVEAIDKVEAISLAGEWFNNAIFLREVSPEEAEAEGLDTY